jgi:hypothetical protein
VHAAEPVVLKLWPEGAPEKSTVVIEPEKRLEPKGPKDVLRITNVSEPTLTVYRPEKANGTAVIVCPGGGYGILAIEHEGTQVCEWLNSLGVTAVLLKYRVPVRNKVPGVPEKLSAQVVAFVQALRGSGLFKPPGLAETLDWAQALVALDALTLSPELTQSTLGVLLKYQDDISKFSRHGTSVEIRSRSWSRICRRSSRKCTVMPSAPEAMQSFAASTGQGKCPPRALRRVAT